MKSTKPEFDSYAAGYSDSIELINSLYHKTFFNNLSDNKERVLDIGCGAGLLLAKLKGLYSEAYGIDNSDAMIAIAKKRFPSLKVKQADAHKLPFKDSYFDMVVSDATFHHLDVKQALCEAKRVLKEGGRLVITDVSISSNKYAKYTSKWIDKWVRLIKLLFKFGARKTRGIMGYYNSDEWSNHINGERDKYLPRDKFKSFYGELLPGARFIDISYSRAAVIWRK